jgi:hypothetical protein
MQVYLREGLIGSPQRQAALFCFGLAEVSSCFAVLFRQQIPETNS